LRATRPPSRPRASLPPSVHRCRESRRQALRLPSDAAAPAKRRPACRAQPPPGDAAIFDAHGLITRLIGAAPTIAFAMSDPGIVPSSRPSGLLLLCWPLVAKGIRNVMRVRPPADAFED